MESQLQIALLILCTGLTSAFDCPRSNGTYPHESNAAAYYRCSRSCSYQESCPPNQFYSSTANQCKPEPADWTPRFDLTGTFDYPGGYYSIPTRQSGYNLYWTAAYDGVEYSFTGRYINETVVIGMEVGLVKSTNCRFLNEFIITVTAKRTFCHTKTLHWYTRACVGRVHLPVCIAY
jgi:hypothetical protein